MTKRRSASPAKPTSPPTGPAPAPPPGSGYAGPSNPKPPTSGQIPKSPMGRFRALATCSHCGSLDGHHRAGCPVRRDTDALPSDRRVVIESPYAGDIANNVAFARAVCRWAILCGYAPYASHLLYTQPGILDDDAPNERQRGIDAGLVWADAADEVWMCLRGEERPSSGMLYAYNRHRVAGRDTVVFRFEWNGSEVSKPQIMPTFDPLRAHE